MTARAYAASAMRGTTDQSRADRADGRRTPSALSLRCSRRSSRSGPLRCSTLGTTAVTLALLAVLGGGALVTSGWLLARVPAQMRGLAGERRRALDDLLRAEEVERERIATELHDDTIQVITAALVTIDRVTPAIRARDVERIAEVLPPTRTMLADAVERVRRLTFELHPPLLEAHGLPVALTDLIDRAAREAGLETDVVVEVGRYTFVVEDLAYRIVREAIADARGHEGTSRLEVDIREHRGAVHGRVWDNGDSQAGRRRDDRPRVVRSPQPRASGRAGAAG